MVKKKNSNDENISSENNEEKTNNLQYNLKLNNIDDENIKEDAFAIYEAINEGKLDLDPQDKKEILKELDLIINHFDSLSNDGLDESLDSDESVDDTLDDLVDGVSSEDSASVEVTFDNSVESVAVDHDVGDLSVDDALDDLVGEVSSEDSLGSEVSSDDFASAESTSDDLVESVAVGNDVGDLSVDDALDDLVEDYSDEVAIKVKNLSMEFKVSKDKIDTLKELFIRTIKRNKSGTQIVTALEDISFEIPKGDRVGIVGFNGAGKSTLLKILAGVYDATEGTIETKGKVAPLLELGAGFDPNYTGKNNIFLNGAFLGYSEDFLKEKYDEILEFSELGDAINYHVKTYSSGMRAKLGFAIATIVEPDILILDEILSVGDIRFRRKSADKLRSLINSGITVLLVSHSVAQIRDLCNKAIWIDEGKLKMYGEVNKVCDAYVQAAAKASRDQLKNIQLD